MATSPWTGTTAATTMIVPREVLEALLSPEAGQRRQAEDYLSRLAPEQRCQAYLTWLSAVPTGPSPSDEEALVQLAAVLLRRAVLQVSSSESLQRLVDPLLQSFLTGSPRSRRAVGHCVAAACQALSWATTAAAATSAASEAACQRVLQVIGPRASEGDGESLFLMSELARSAPAAFAATAAPPQLSHLVSALILGNSSPDTTTDENRARLFSAAAQLAVEAGAAANAVNAVSCGAAPLAHLGWIAYSEEDADATSPAAVLGESYLLPLLRHCAEQLSVRSMSFFLVEPLLQVAERVPSLVSRPAVLEAALQYCLAVVVAPPAPSLSIRDRLQALEVVSSLMERPELKKLLKASLEPCLLCCWQLLSLTDRVVLVDDDDSGEDWDGSGDEGDEDDAEEERRETVLYAEDLLQSLLHSLGAPALPVLLSQVEAVAAASNQGPTFAASNSIRAALAALRCCVAALPVGTAPHRHAAADLALAALTAAASSPGVRGEALVLLGVLVQQYPDLQATCAPTLFPTFADLLVASAPTSSQANGRLSPLTCRAIVSLCRGSSDALLDSTLLVPHLPALVAALAGLVHPCAPLRLQRFAYSSLACLAQVAQSDFAPYYPAVMPLLLQALEVQPPPGDRSGSATAEWRSAALEAATLVGESVDDPALFGPDASRILQVAVRVLQQQVDHDSWITPEVVWSACARIASALPELYIPYAGVIVPLLLQRATDRSDVELSEGTELGLEATQQGLVERREYNDAAAGSESMTVAVPGRGLTKVTIHTSKIRDKVVAVKALQEHAAALGTALGPYCDTCLSALTPLVQFRYSSDLRGASAQALAAAFEAACRSGEDSTGMALPVQHFPRLVAALSQQLEVEDSVESEAVLALAEALSEIHCSVYRRLEEHGTQLLSQYSLSESLAVVKRCVNYMVNCLHRRAKVAALLAGSNGTVSDDEQLELTQKLEGEAELLNPLVDCVGYNLKFFREDFVGIFEGLVVPVMGPYLSPGHDLRSRVAAICLFDDCVEHCGLAAASKFAPVLMEGAVRGIQDESCDSDLLRASIYGVAQVARYAPSSVAMPYQDQILPQLLSIVSGNRDSDDVVFENAVSALASLTLIGHAPLRDNCYIEREQFLKTFLSSLPLTVDYDESKICNAGLCDLVDKGIVRLDSPAQCSEVLRVIGEVLSLVDEGDNVATSETCLRFAAILFRLQREVPDDLLQRCFGEMSPEGQAAVQKAMGQYAEVLGAVVTP